MDADYGIINRAVNNYRQEWLKKHINIVHNGYKHVQTSQGHWIFHWLHYTTGVKVEDGMIPVVNQSYQNVHKPLNTESKSNNQILDLFPALTEVPPFAVFPDISWKIPLTCHNQSSVHVVEITGSWMDSNSAARGSHTCINDRDYLDFMFCFVFLETSTKELAIHWPSVISSIIGLSQ